MVFGKIARWGFTTAVSLYVVTHYTSLLVTNSGLLLALLSVFGLAMLFFALCLLRGKAAVLPLFLISTAVVIGIASPDTNAFFILWEGARVMRSLISLLIVIPIVGWVLKQENYVEDTIILLKKWLKNSKAFYFVIMFITQLISFFLLLGSAPVVYQILQTFFPDKKSVRWQSFKTTSVLRGFSLTTIWVISIPSFAYAVEALNAPLVVSFVQGFMISFAGLILAVIYLYVFEKRQELSFSKEIRHTIAVAADKTNGKDDLHRTPVEFVVLFLSLLILTLVVNFILPISLLTVIPLVVVVWALIYFIVKRKMPAFFMEGKQYVSIGISHRAQEITILFSAGLLISSMNSSGLSEALMQALYNWTESVPGLNFLWILPLITLMFSFLGMGPMTVMALMAGIIQSIHLPYPPELVVLAMTMGSALSVMLSPLILVVIMLSSMNGLSGIENSLKQNWKYAIGLYFLVELYIQLRIL